MSTTRLPQSAPGNHPQALPRPRKFAAPLRVSSSGQTRADRYGYDEQRDDILAKARELGYTEADAVWLDFWESATDASARPKFLEKLDEIIQLRDARIIDTVIFGRPDRLSRDGEGWFFTYLTALEGHGKAQVRFGRDDVDPANPHRNFLLFLHAFKARADGATIKLNTVPARRKRAEHGKLPTGSRPDRPLFGYRYIKETGRREFDPETRPCWRS